MQDSQRYHPSPLGTGYLKWTGAGFTTEMMPGFVRIPAVIDVDLNGHNITGNSDGTLTTPGDDSAVPSQKAVKTYVPNAPLCGRLAVGVSTFTSASHRSSHGIDRVALNDAKVSHSRSFIRLSAIRPQKMGPGKS